MSRHRGNLQWHSFNILELVIDIRGDGIGVIDRTIARVNMRMHLRKHRTNTTPSQQQPQQHVKHDDAVSRGRAWVVRSHGVCRACALPLLRC